MHKAHVLLAEGLGPGLDNISISVLIVVKSRVTEASVFELSTSVLSEALPWSRFEVCGVFLEG